MAKKVDKKSVAIPAISVITAMYNAEKYVAQCLESLLAQKKSRFKNLKKLPTLTLPTVLKIFFMITQRL